MSVERESQEFEEEEQKPEIPPNGLTEDQLKEGFILPENWQKRAAMMTAMTGEIAMEEDSKKREELMKEFRELHRYVMDDLEKAERNLDRVLKYGEKGELNWQKDQEKRKKRK